jgi:hypothetical protein
MRCESFLDRFDRLDAGEEPGLLLRLHLSRCPSCRARVEGLDAAIESWRAQEGEALPAREAEAVEGRVMAAVRLMPRPHRELHARNWILAGLVIVASMAFIPYDRNFLFIKELFGESYTLPLFLVLGLLLTVYGAVFIGTHMEELEPYVKRRMPRA